jgi:hypothetical protein
MTTAIIKARVSSEGHPCTDVFIDHAGKRFYSRINYPIADSRYAREAQIQNFLNRQRRYDSDATPANTMR